MLKVMKVFRLSLVLSLFVSAIAFAQDDNVITDEDLMHYKAIVDAVDSMKAQMKEEYNDMIQAEELMQGGKRFKEIKQTKGDSLKLAELSVTQEEQAIFDKIQSSYADMKAKFKESYTSIIKEKLGIKKYNEIKKGIKKGELKERYDALSAK